MIKNDETKLNIGLHKCPPVMHSEDLLASESVNRETRSRTNMEEITQEIKQRHCSWLVMC